MEIPRFQKNKINIVFINVYLIISTMFRSIVNNFIQLTHRFNFYSL